MGIPKMVGLQEKIPLKWMIWGYLYFWKPPYVFASGCIPSCRVKLHGFVEARHHLSIDQREHNLGALHLELQSEIRNWSTLQGRDWLIFLCPEVWEILCTCYRFAFSGYQRLAMFSNNWVLDRGVFNQGHPMNRSTKPWFLAGVCSK